MGANDFVGKVSLNSGTWQLDTDFVISGTNNNSGGGNFNIVSSTDIATPLSNWIFVSGGTLSDGTFNVTNTLAPDTRNRNTPCN